MHVTIRDVARRAGVSNTSVSLAFQPNSRLSGRRRQQILDIAEKLGYTPNRQARALKGGKTRTIGVLISDITNPFYALIAREAQRIAEQHHYEVLIADSRWETGHELAEVQRMINAQVDGMLGCFGLAAKKSSDLLTEAKLPHIALDTFPESYRGAYVANDVTAASRVAVEHLLSIGCRRIAFLDADQQSMAFSAFVELRAEFLKTLAAHGVAASSDQIFAAGLDIAAGRKAFPHVREKMPDVDGLFCANTLCAVGAMEAARAMNIQIPQQLAVIGIDDLDLCQLECISLTAIRQPYQQLAKMATEILVDAIEAGQAPTLQLSLKPELIVRHSTSRAVTAAAAAL